MGQKINPQILRLGILYQWQSRWFDERKYKDVLLEDHTIRHALLNRLKTSGVGRIEIERSINSIKITAFVSRPGMVIGRAGTGLEELKKYINSLFLKIRGKKSLPKIDIRIEPIKEPNLDSYLVAQSIVDQLIRRMPYKRILNQTVNRVMDAGAKGVRIVLAGRIAGAEIGRREKIQVGKVPLSTIREYINFTSMPALTKKGYIGVKVWINRPEGK